MLLSILEHCPVNKIKKKASTNLKLYFFFQFEAIVMFVLWRGKDYTEKKERYKKHKAKGDSIWKQETNTDI